MAKALYRKYRPKTLEGIVGQSQVTDVLAKSLKAGKISHAYLFVGPRGTGKTSVARILAHQINGFNYEVEDDYVDIIEIDGASNRGIDNIRELREKALIAPTSGKYKVYIIDEVHMLTKEAFNALLKILEEPPKHVIFIMATTDAYKVPVTITSRAQTYTFTLADKKTMFDFLKSVAEKETINIDDKALSLIVKKGGGSFRDSLSLLDQISTLSDSEITEELVVSAMGLPEDEKIEELLEEYSNGDIVRISKILKNLLVSGVKPETLTEELISNIIDNPKLEYLSLLSKLPEVKAPFPEAKLLVALTDGILGTPQQRSARNATARELTPNLRDDRSLGREQHPIDALTGHAQKRETPNTSTNGPLHQATSGATTLTTNNISFVWDEFLNRVKEANDAIYSQLLKTEYQFSNGVLNIFPLKKIVKTILERDTNKRILVEAGGGIKININEVGTNKPKDATLAKISDIMGGEVKNDGGENPF